MNLFFLDENPDLCAQYHVDKHCAKIIVEAAQCMASAYPKGEAPYKWAYHNHPMTVWVRHSLSNFQYTVNYAKKLCAEYSYRYERVHKTESVCDWYAQNLPHIDDLGLTEPPRCFGTLKDSIPITGSVFEDYRQYYRLGKAHLFSWKKRAVPHWI